MCLRGMAVATGLLGFAITCWLSARVPPQRELQARLGGEINEISARLRDKDLLLEKARLVHQGSLTPDNLAVVFKDGKKVKFRGSFGSQGLTPPSEELPTANMGEDQIQTGIPQPSASGIPCLMTLQDACFAAEQLRSTMERIGCSKFRIGLVTERSPCAGLECLVGTVEK